MQIGYIQGLKHPRSCVPVEDEDVISDTLLRARPVVLRGYAQSWKARSWGLEEVAAAAPEAHVELQVSRQDQTLGHCKGVMSISFSRVGLIGYGSVPKKLEGT